MKQKKHDKNKKANAKYRRGRNRAKEKEYCKGKRVIKPRVTTEKIKINRQHINKQE